MSTLQELQHLGVGFVALTEALDLATPTGRARAGLLSVFAEFERDILRERVRAGLAHARQQGKQLGRPPSVVHSAAAVWKLCRQGVSKSEIACRLQIGRTSVRRLLTKKKSEFTQPRRTLVYQIDDLTRLLWVGQERTVETFRGFFSMIGPDLSSKIEFVCSDMWKPYLRVIREKCSQALHILERFHIVAKMNQALDEVRAAEARHLAAAGHQPLLKKTRWCLLKRKQNLTGEQRFRLRDLLRFNLKTVRAYLLKEDFQQFWEYQSATWAGKFLTEWCHQAMCSRIEPMKKVARMLRAHRDLILNYFKAQKLFSSGVIEGLNNKAKVTMRKSYG